jgi:hypothetical protein
MIERVCGVEFNELVLNNLFYFSLSGIDIYTREGGGCKSSS